MLKSNQTNRGLRTYARSIFGLPLMLKNDKRQLCLRMSAKAAIALGTGRGSAAEFRFKLENAPETVRDMENPGPKIHQRTLFLDTELIAKLDSLAERSGLTRAETVESILRAP